MTAMPVPLNSYLITCAQKRPTYKVAAYRVNRKSQAAQYCDTRQTLLASKQKWI